MAQILQFPNHPAEADTDPWAPAAALIRAGEWQAGLAAVQGALEKAGEPNGELQLLSAIARIRTDQASLETLTADLVKAGNPQDVRRLLVTWLAQEGKLDEAVQTLGVVIEAFPSAVEERVHRSNLYARQQRWTEAIADLDDITANAGHVRDQAGLDAKRLQYRIRAGRAEEAAALALKLDLAEADDRTLNLMLLALIHAKNHEGAADLSARIDVRKVADPKLAANVVQAFYWAERHTLAIEAGEALLRRGLDSPHLRSFLGRAWLGGGVANRRLVKAIEHFEAGIAQSPDDLRMVSLLGEVLLRAGKPDRALPHLRKAVEMEPEMAQVRARYARALKQVGDHSEAANQFVAAMDKTKGPARWQRLAAGALSLAGRREEAADMFDAWVATREKTLPENFGEGLDALWDAVDSVEIPRPRLDWAWSLRSPDCTLDRAEWERRAAWGYLADHYLLDWLECRSDQVEQAMVHFSDDLDRVEGFLAEARARAPGKGVVLASAHVGAMYFGPLALELLGERTRWLASTPSVARTAYAESVISTSDQTEPQVGVAFMRALKENFAVVVVVDGAINLAAPRVEFEGQDITFSEFAARTAQRLGSPTAFVAPVWREGNRLGFVLEHLPMPQEAESADDYAARWREAYFGHLRSFLSGPPENLRLAGGIWRNIH